MRVWLRSYFGCEEPSRWRHSQPVSHLAYPHYNIKYCDLSLIWYTHPYDTFQCSIFILIAYFLLLVLALFVVFSSSLISPSFPSFSPFPLLTLPGGIFQFIRNTGCQYCSPPLTHTQTQNVVRGEYSTYQPLCKSQSLFDDYPGVRSLDINLSIDLWVKCKLWRAVKY